MLLGQDFGGGHDGALGAVGDRQPQRSRCHRGLARADVPLQQTAHRYGLRQIAADMAEGSALRRGQLEREGGGERSQCGVIALNGPRGRPSEPPAEPGRPTARRRTRRSSTNGARPPDVRDYPGSGSGSARPPAAAARPGAAPLPAGSRMPRPQMVKPFRSSTPRSHCMEIPSVRG